MDRPPTAVVTEPASDVSVLAGAAVPLAADGRDDVGLAWVELEASIPGVEASGSEETAGRVVLARVEGAAVEGGGGRATAGATLELAGYGLEPGMVVEVVGVAQDVLDLEGEVHAPVRSAVRRVRVIDEATLVGEVRSELGAVRRRALRAEAAQ
ncbi:MAG: hypothetical protein AAF078_08045, partial [Planctomycetota bacterium]